MKWFSGLIGFGKIRAMNVVLLLISVFFIAWIGVIWLKPVPDFNGITEIRSPKKTAVQKDGPSKASQVSYDVIIEKDLFKESRRKFVPKPITVAVKPTSQPVPPPPPKRPPPKLVLIGTVLMSDERKAIIEYGGKRDYYGAGEVIEEFVIDEIGPGHVLLDRDGEPLKIVPAN